MASYGAGFTLVSDRANEDGIQVAITSQAYTIGDMLQLAVGATTWSVGAATTQHWQLKAIAMETVTSAATTIQVQSCYTGQMWAAELANNSSANHNGDRMILTDLNTVNNTGSDDTSQNAVFIQYQPVGATGDKRALGWIVYGAGVDPDAT